MSLTCFISNEVTDRPCVSPLSGHVFDRRLIEKYLAENGTDPVTNQPLSEDQLVDIKGQRAAGGSRASLRPRCASDRVPCGARSLHQRDLKDSMRQLVAGTWP
ncbi:hypothetical protein FKM82_029117 [Ascaphus truei]